jgi:predicted DNA-binding antitoxin AbrB/MazE fold protein
MTTHVTAIYENGVLRPTRPLPLKHGDQVEITVEVPASAGTSDEAARRIRTAKTFDEWIAAAGEAAQSEPADGYDLLAALNETRRQAGERLLFPPERKGIDW